MKIADKFSPDNIFFTSDHHFYHKNIIEFSKRPFKDLGHMHQSMIEIWNMTVPSDGVVFHLGDFSFSDGRRLADLTKMLNGEIYICVGNHDKMKTLLAGFHVSRIADVWEIRVDEQRLFLSHYAHKVWRGSHKGTWHLYGHSHGSLHEDPYSLSMDVGVDTNDFHPYSFKEIKKRMLVKEFKPLDHHGRNKES